MLRLLLREDRHDIRDEYFLRLLSICLFFLIALMVIWAFVLLSLYVQVRIENKIATAELTEIKNSDISNDWEEVSRLSGVIKEKISYLDEKVYDPSVFIDLVIENETDGIELDTIEVEFRSVTDEKDKNIGKNVVINLKGVSDNRSELVEFQKKIAAQEVFDHVEIPYSSFTTNTRIPFNLNIVSVELGKYFENDKQ